MDLTCLIESCRIASANTWDMKFVPRSVWTVFGRPKREKNPNRALIIIGAVILRSGIASGKQVRLHMMVSNHWFPDFVRGN